MIKSKNKVNVNFSMSGMTDIVFLLLIFFMLTSTLVAPNALKLLLPNRSQVTTSEPTVPEVILQKNGTIIVDGKRTEFNSLQTVLNRKLSGRKDPAIKLITAHGVTVKETVKVMNVAAENNYQVVLKKEE